MTAMFKTCATVEGAWHRCGARRLRCGLDSSTQSQDENSRNATIDGLKIVSESSQKQEDKVNSECHELLKNRLQMSEHAMKPHTYLITVVCVVLMGKGRAKPHLQRPVESVKVREFEMDFCNLLQDPKRRHEPGPAAISTKSVDPKRRHQPGDQVWATTLVMVDVAAQNPSCAAISTKYDENAYLSAVCAAVVKRMAYANAVLKVDPESALKLLADKIAVRASADGIQLKVETAPRFRSQSIGAVGPARDGVEGQIRCLRLELETRLSLEVTPAIDVWPWMVRHAGWLLERYHVKGKKKTAFEDCFGKPYQGEVMKFAEAALFRVAMSPSGKIRDGLRQGRADARFVRGMWLGKTTESDEHLFANEMEVHTTRTGKRVPDTEQKRADLVKGLQGTPWNRLAGRPAGRPRKTDPQATPVATSPVAKETERPSEDADERRSAKAQDLNPPTVPRVIRVPRAADTENEPRSSSSRPMETEDGSARDNTASDDCPQAPVPAPSSPMEQADRTGGQQPVSTGVKRDARTAVGHNVKSVNHPEQSKSNMGSGVKRALMRTNKLMQKRSGANFQWKMTS